MSEGRFWGEALSDEDFQEVLSQAVPDGMDPVSTETEPPAATVPTQEQPADTPPVPSPVPPTPQPAAQSDVTPAAPVAAAPVSDPPAPTPPDPTPSPADPVPPQQMTEAERKVAGYEQAIRFAAAQADARAKAEQDAQEEAVAQQLEAMLANGELPPDQALFVTQNLRAWERQRATEEMQGQLTQATNYAEASAKKDTIEYWGDQFQLTREERNQLSQFNDPIQMGNMARWIRGERDKMTQTQQANMQRIAELEMQVTARDRAGNPVDAVDGQPGIGSLNPEDAEDFDEFFNRLGSQLPQQFRRTA